MIIQIKINDLQSKQTYLYPHDIWDGDLSYDRGINDCQSYIHLIEIRQLNGDCRDDNQNLWSLQRDYGGNFYAMPLGSYNCTPLSINNDGSAESYTSCGITKYLGRLNIRIM